MSAAQTRGDDPLYVAALKLLEDGQWHDYEKVIARLSRRVMPGVAARKTEEIRAGLARRKAAARGLPNPDRGRQRPISLEAAVASGARHLVGRVLSRSAFEIAPKGKVVDKKIRLRPTPPHRRGGK